MKRGELSTLTVGELLERANRSAAARRYLESLTLYRTPLVDLERMTLARDRRRASTITRQTTRRTKRS